ncbi:hypothetical protein D3C80_1073870 [compost metagenome]
MTVDDGEILRSEFQWHARSQIFDTRYLANFYKPQLPVRSIALTELRKWSVLGGPATIRSLDKGNQSCDISPIHLPFFQESIHRLLQPIVLLMKP